jgi:hypothetical protein
VRNSYTFEEYHGEIDGDPYVRHTGVMVTGGSLTVPANEIASLSYNLIGKDFSTASAALDGSVDPVTNGLPLAGLEGEVFVGGTDYAGRLTAFSLTFENNVGGQPTLARNTVQTRFLGNLGVTGEMSVYLSDRQLEEAFDGESELSLVIRLVAENGSDFLAIELPRVKLTGATRTLNANDGVVLTVPFEALDHVGRNELVRFQRSNA